MILVYAADLSARFIRQYYAALQYGLSNLFYIYIKNIITELLECYKNKKAQQFIKLNQMKQLQCNAAKVTLVQWKWNGIIGIKNFTEGIVNGYEQI